MMEELPLARKMINNVQQDATYKLQDLIEGYSPITKIIAIAAIKSNIDALLMSLDDNTRDLINSLVMRTEVVILPSAFDPRKQEEQK
ncbi:MAG: hypothetical protein IKO00_03535 [Oscillospiraceae bacterium]|nr:hypothetical protein [Oscillospiraceae bacterium]